MPSNVRGLNHAAKYKLSIAIHLAERAITRRAASLGGKLNYGAKIAVFIPWARLASACVQGIWEVRKILIDTSVTLQRPLRYRSNGVGTATSLSHGRRSAPRGTVHRD